MSDKTVQPVGVSFCGLLFLVFLTLKLTEHINWSWWWVTAPLWGPIALIVALLIATFIALVIKHVVRNFLKEARK